MPPEPRLRTPTPRSVRSDAAVSEVLATVLLVGTTVVVLGGFVGLVLTSAQTTPVPPVASLAIEAAEGDAHLVVRFVSGTPLALGGADVVALVNASSATESTDLLDPATPGIFAPGDRLRVNLTGANTPLGAGARLQVLVVDRETGKSIGSTTATLLGEQEQPAYIASSPHLVEAALDPALLVVDGSAMTNLTVRVNTTQGLTLVRSVSVNLSQVGGPVEAALADDGQGADALAGDGTYTLQFAAEDYTFTASPGVETVALPVVVRDVFGKTESTTLGLSVTPAPLSKVTAGAKYRPIPSSDTLLGLNLTNLTFRDADALDNDQIVVRVSDLSDSSKTWSALVSFNSSATCGGLPGITRIELRRDDTAGSVVYTPQSETCLTLGSLSRINLADPSASLDATGSTISWAITGSEATFLYSAAGIGSNNEAVITFMGDSQSPAPSAFGLGQADLEWRQRVDNNPPEASFSSTTDGLRVDVDASASTDPDGEALAYAWDWGDGDSDAASATATASHTYAAAGNYTVTLTVEDAAGGVDAVSALVGVNRAPVANFTASSAGLTLDADGTGSADPDGQALSYSWDWGDGSSTGSGATASHTYAIAGTYTVTLTVRDTFSATHSTSLDLTVSLTNAPPTADLTANTTSGSAPLTVGFTVDGLDLGGSIASWTLQFGDGTSAAGSSVPATATKTYEAEGTFQANLTVVDDAGVSSLTPDTLTITVSANGAPSIGSFSTSSSSLTAFVNATASDPDGQAISYTVAWGDGATTELGDLASISAQHAYATGGNYTVTLYVNDTAGGSTQATSVVTVNRAPAITGFTTEASGLVGYANTSANDPDGQAISYTVAWGDGATSTSGDGGASALSHEYSAAGTYTVTVYVNDTLGGSASSAGAFTTSAAGTAPTAPRSLTASPANNQVGLNWTWPSSNGTSALTGYKIYRGTTSGTHSLLTTIGTNLTFTDRTAVNGTTYYYVVRASSGAGDSSASNEVSATPSDAVSVDCSSMTTTSGALSSCASIQHADLVYGALDESGGGSAKSVSMTFTMNLTGVTGTQTLQLNGYNSKNGEDLLLQAQASNGTFMTIATLPSTATTATTVTGLVDQATYWPDDRLTIRIIDGGADPASTTWQVDFFRMVT